MNPKKGISSKNKQQRDKFMNIIEDKSINKILQELTELNKKETWQESDHTAFKICDTEFTKLLINADKKCIIPNKAKWSVELHNKYLIWKYWKIEMNKKRIREHSREP